LPLPQRPLKMALSIKMVKIDSNNHLVILI
jgi:hypothetical protein